MSAQKKRPTSVLGAVLGFVGFSAIAGLLVTIGVTPALAVGSVTASSSIGIFNNLPEYISIGQLQQRNTLYAQQGGKQVEFATLYDQNRVNLKWDDVSVNLKNAAVDGEDRRFYEHGGVDLTSIVRAGLGTVSGRELGAGGGGSTLTMQLVKNIRLAQAQNISNAADRASAVQDATDETVSRKLQEMKLAIGLEKKYTKDQILLAYLNIAYFGDQAYGVEAAAEHYYNKTAKDLSPVEAASLIAIVQYPTSRNLSTPKNYDANVARRNVILASMLQEKSITKTDYDAAVAAKPGDYVVLTPPTNGCAAVTWPGAQYFCDYVQQNVKNFSFLGSDASTREKNWKTGGYQVHTTLNLDLTASAKGQLDSYAPNTESRFALGSVVDSIEPSTGRIVVMAQNKTYSQVEGDSTATAINYSTDQAYGSSQGFQTGSTYKLFTLVDWLNKGHGLYETVNATRRPITPMTTCGVTRSTVSSAFPSGYNPKNDEINLGGTMNILTATADSVNVAYVAMAQELDLCDIRTTAESMGVHLADERKTKELSDTPASVLGTNNIAPLTMASAYATIANGGKYCAPIMVDKAIGPNGNELAGQSQDCKQVVSPDVAAAVVNAMQGVFTHGTAVGAKPNDSIPQFGKTGTTNNADQIWLIGSSTALTTVVWMGDTSGKQTSLRLKSSPNHRGTTYAASRSAFFKAVQTVNDTVYKGGAFPTVSQAMLRGNGISVPDVSGQTSDQAQATLKSAGLNYTDGGTQAGSQPAGDAQSSSPGAGSIVSKGAYITVYSSDGSQAASVPTVTGQPLKSALSSIQSSGFDPTKVTVTFAQGQNNAQCSVLSSTPSGGSSASKDTAIALQVSGTTDGKDPGTCS
ncbi:transglycosylase domain-containing protein [Frondihabitans cladoniiphilus]|uniref:Transglycosylase domain-containing protein n=1 Tax=Frondihabitans cladoniiphilus TaxID=715785 RepID=A0ABP8W2A8_9MICO